MRPDESDATVCQSGATSDGDDAGTRAVVVLARASQAFEPGTTHYHVPFLAQLVGARRTLIAECATVLARLRATDQHAAIPIDLNGLRATPG